jgi:hypothetical protein
MDKAAPPGKNVLWHFCQRCEDSNLGCHDCISFARNLERTISIGTKSIPIITLFGSEHI